MDSVAKATSSSEHLSQEELKARLFLKLKEDGTFNGCRALLRNELVKHLYLIEPQKVCLQPKFDSDEELLVRYPLEATNWLISEHLTRNHYDFTLSVFALESGMAPTRKNLSIGDILTFLHIDSNSQIGQKILGAYKAKEDTLFLWTLLSASITKSWQSKEESGNQTVSPEKKPTIRMEERLQRVDDDYDFKKRALREDRESIGNGLAQLEEILKTPERHAPPNLLQFRDVDLQSFHESKLRDYQGEVDKLRRSLEEQHHQKLQLLMERERGVQGDLEKQKAAMESDFFVHRQKMLLEITKQQQREEEWENKKRFQEKMMQIETERIESIKEAVQNREERLRQQERAHEHWLTEQKQQIEASIHNKYDEKQNELDRRELELKNFEEKLNAKEILLKERETAYEKAIRDTTEVKFELTSTKEKLKTLQEENASLQICANAATENRHLKDELHRLQLLNKQALARNEAEEIRHNTVLQEFLDRLTKPSPQAIFLQQELGKFREQHQKDSEAWFKQKAILESAVYRERSQLKLCSDRMKMQSRQIAILHKTIDDLQQEILKKTSNSEVPQKHVTFKPSTSTEESRPELGFMSLRETPTMDFHGTYFDTSLNPSYLPPELELGVSGLLTDYDFEYDGSYTGVTSGLPFSGDSFDETRARIKHLEEEAELLERTFKSFKRNSCHSVPQMIFPNKSIFNDKKLTSGKSFTSSYLNDYNKQESSDIKDLHRQESTNLEYFSRQVSCSTPNDSLAKNIPRIKPTKQCHQLDISQGDISLLNDNSKTIKLDNAWTSFEGAMTPNSINRKLTFELNEDEMRLKQNDLLAHFDKNVVIGSETVAENKFGGNSIQDEKSGSGDMHSGGNVGSAINSNESIPKAVPINLDSAWKSTTQDSPHDLHNISNEDDIKLKTDGQLKPSAIDVSQEEFVPAQVVKDHKFALAYGSRKANENDASNDEADGEGNLSWERASIKSNNGDDFEW